MTPSTPRLGRADDRQRYVVGFAFDLAERRMALIWKKRQPDGAGMIGLLNGIGGKVRPRESYRRAMVREFHQETGGMVAGQLWKLFAIIDGPTYRLHCFAAWLDSAEFRSIQTLGKSVTDEVVQKVPVRRVVLELAPSTRPEAQACYPDVPSLVAIALRNDLWSARAVHIDRRDI